MVSIYSPSKKSSPAPTGDEVEGIVDGLEVGTTVGAAVDGL